MLSEESIINSDCFPVSPVAYKVERTHEDAEEQVLTQDAYFRSSVVSS